MRGGNRKPAMQRAAETVVETAELKQEDLVGRIAGGNFSVLPTQVREEAEDAKTRFATAKDLVDKDLKRALQNFGFAMRAMTFAREDNSRLFTRGKITRAELNSFRTGLNHYEDREVSNFAAAIEVRMQ